MALQENEISWQVLRRIVHEWAGPAAELVEVRPLVGGCVNTTLSLMTGGGERAVLKISTHRVNRELAREAGQLQMLRGLGLPVPEVYLVNVASLDNPDSYVLMQFMEGMDLKTARSRCTPEQYDELQGHLAELVLVLHQQMGSSYHREGGEDHAQFAGWAEFYRHVYDPIWHDLEKSTMLPIRCRKQIGRVHERLERLIAHEDRPRLVHWDIWSSNILAKPDADGKWRVSAVLDPNCKYAHAEAEIAYMELFHTITPAFLKTYQQDHRLGDGYHRVRKLVYQLYPLINHVHLFGHEYVKPLLAAVERVAPLV